MAKHLGQRQKLEIGTKLLYMPAPAPVLYIVPLSHILLSSVCWELQHYSEKHVALQGRLFDKGHMLPGSGSPLFYINTWAFISKKYNLLI